MASDYMLDRNQSSTERFAMHENWIIFILIRVDFNVNMPRISSFYSIISVNDSFFPDIHFDCSTITILTKYRCVYYTEESGIHPMMADPQMGTLRKAHSHGQTTMWAHPY